MFLLRLFSLKCRNAALRRLRFYLPISRGKQHWVFIFCTCVATGFLPRNVLPGLSGASVVEPLDLEMRRAGILYCQFYILWCQLAVCRFWSPSLIADSVWNILNCWKLDPISLPVHSSLVNLAVTARPFRRPWRKDITNCNSSRSVPTYRLLFF